MYTDFQALHPAPLQTLILFDMDKPSYFDNAYQYSFFEPICQACFLLILTPIILYFLMIYKIFIFPASFLFKYYCILRKILILITILINENYAK